MSVTSIMAKRFFQQYRLIGSEVGRVVPFLKETSCMDQETRYLIAGCKMYMLLFPENKEFNEFLGTVIKVLEFQGHALWKRDILTDMALRMTREKARGNLRKLKK